MDEQPFSPGLLADELDRLAVRLLNLDDRYARLFELSLFLEHHLEAAPHAINLTPYLLEILDSIIQSTAFEGGISCNPVRLKDVAMVFVRWTPKFPKDVHKDLNEAIDRIHLEVMIAEAQVGAISHASKIFEARVEEKEPVRRVNNLLSLLEKLIAIHRPQWGPTLAERLLSVRRDLSLKGSAGFFPAVLGWSSRDSSTNKSLRGIVARASCRISDFAENGDELECRHLSSSRGNETSVLWLQPVLSAGRGVLLDIVPDGLERSYRGNFRIEQSEAVLEGDSMKALLALLYAIEIVRFLDQRTTIALEAGTLLTGSIDPSGVLLPVDGGTLKQKIEAAFFSGMDRLIVPIENASDAKTALAELRSIYPNGRLEIIARDSLADIANDRRIVRIERKSLPTYTRQKIRWHSAQVIPSALFLLLAMILFAALYSAPDPHITNYVADPSSTLFFSNDDGDIIHASPIENITLRSMQDKASRFVTIGDVNHDGFNDLFWLESAELKTGTPNKLTGLDGKTLDTLFVFNPNFDLDYPNDISIVHGNMRGKDIVLFDVDSDGQLELLASFEHAEFYPSVLVAMNPLTGEIEQRYDHPGALRDFMVVDLDGDGHAEIVAGGANNSMKAPVFIVLDASDFNDVGPASRPQYEPGPERIGKEKLYYILPETPITEFAPVPNRMGEYMFIQADGSLSLSVTDVYDSYDGGRKTGANFFVYFDAMYSPISIGTSTFWDIVYDKAADTGMVPRFFSNEMKIEILNNIERIQ